MTIRSAATTIDTAGYLGAAYRPRHGDIALLIDGGALHITPATARALRDALSVALAIHDRDHPILTDTWPREQQP